MTGAAGASDIFIESTAGVGIRRLVEGWMDYDDDEPVLLVVKVKEKKKKKFQKEAPRHLGGGFQLITIVQNR